MSMFFGFQTLFFIAFAVIVVVFVIILVRNIGQWNRNNQSPRLCVPAQVAAKREDVSSHHHNTGVGAGHTTHSTTYYVTFQVESGDRMELSLSGSEYGLLAEGDVGRLTFQGTRYLGFERA